MNAGRQERARGGWPGDADEDWPVVVEPSWWAFCGWLACGWLLVPLGVAIWKQASTRLRIYPDRLVIESGVVRKRIVDLALADLRAMEVRQSFWQRLVRIGDLRLAGSAGVGGDLVLRGVRDPRAVHDRIASCRRALADAAAWPPERAR